MLELEAEMSREYRERHAGKVLDVLFEEEKKIDGNRYMTGFSREYVRVAVKTDADLSNTVGRVKAGRLLSDEILEGELIK